ncbi:uncharacterized protein J3D65DRAFT_6390 [Phyllosticta citribraziliensis]|uniref:MYND-type domain-containing protein n=1 Tax=Phyllosticta citribraziliensis TaxID=989973 RepID=A0ABR1M8A0_9PEZI
MATVDASAAAIGASTTVDVDDDEAQLNERVKAICGNPGSPPRASRSSSSDRPDLHKGHSPEQDHHHHHLSSSSSSTPSCATCRRRDSKLPTGLIPCVRCKQALYCSLDCQESDEPTHLPKCISRERARPVYQEYIDAYRLRVEDEYVFAGIATGVHNSTHQHPLKGFIRFLDHAEERGVVPRWWTAAARTDCERQAWFGEGVLHPLDKINVIEKYQDPLKPMELRILAERVYGWPIPGFTYTGAEL